MKHIQQFDDDCNIEIIRLIANKSIPTYFVELNQNRVEDFTILTVESLKKIGRQREVILTKITVTSI